MPANLHMDVHVPRAVTNQLDDVLTANEDGAARLDDESLLIRSTELRRVLVTQDIGFHVRATTWQADGKPFSGLAFANQLSITAGQFVRDLEIIAKASLDGECDNQIFRLPF